MYFLADLMLVAIEKMNLSNCKKCYMQLEKVVYTNGKSKHIFPCWQEPARKTRRAGKYSGPGGPGGGPGGPGGPGGWGGYVHMSKRSCLRAILLSRRTSERASYWKK